MFDTLSSYLINKLTTNMNITGAGAKSWNFDYKYMMKDEKLKMRSMTQQAGCNPVGRIDAEYSLLCTFVLT